jgi:hypothetical protein
MILTHKELEEKKQYARQEIFNYICVGGPIERAVNRVFKDFNIPLYIKQELRAEFAKYQK